MKALWFLPLAYVADVHGFAVFAPYAALCLIAVSVMRLRRARSDAPAALVPVRS